MKKINKKIKLVVLASILTLGTFGCVGYYAIKSNQQTTSDLTGLTNGNNSFLNENKDIVFNGQNYLNVADATNQLLSNSKDVSVKDDLYIGNISDAIINSNNYDLVNTNKLKPYDVSKINKAYKTSLGSYVKDYNEAKKSMIGSQEVKYMDYEFNEYRSEARAKDAIISKTNSIPMSYYKVFDPVSKKQININPLNKDDQIALKKIAINSLNSNYASSFIDGNENKFKLGKYISSSSDSNKYSSSNLGSDQNLDVVKGKYKSFFNDFIFKKAKDYSLYDVKMTAIPDKNLVDFVGGYADISYSSSQSNSIVNKDLSTFNSRKNEMRIGSITNDLKFFADRNQFVNKFNVTEALGLANWKIWARNATSNGSLFGNDLTTFNYSGTQVNFNAGFVHNVYSNNVDFFQGDHVSVFFNASIRPKEITDESQKNSLRNDIIQDARSQKLFSDFLKKDDINELEKLNETDKNLVYEIDRKMKNILSEISVDNFWYSNNPVNLNQSDITSISNPRNIIDKIEQFSIKKINSDEALKELWSTNNSKENLRNSYFKDVADDMDKIMYKLFGDNSSYLNEDIFYTINYNNTPLFKIFDENFSYNYSLTEDENLNKLIFGFSNNLNQIDSNLKNISNNVFLSNVNNNFVQNFEFRKLNNKFNTRDNLISFKKNGSLNLIDYSNLINSNIQIKGNIENRLNQFKKDDINLLNNSNGIFQSIYYYNKNLESFDSSEIYQDKLISDANDIVVLWNKNNSLETSHYGEMLGNSSDFNAPLNNSNKKRIFSSLDELNNEKETILKLDPIQLYIVKDQFGNILNYEKFDPNNFVYDDKLMSDGYGTNEEIAYQNALNKISIFSDKDYVFYEDTLIKNEVNKLYSLTLDKNLTKNAINLTYTFTKYQNMYSYLYDYVKLNSTNIYG